MPRKVADGGVSDRLFPASERPLGHVDQLRPVELGFPMR